MFARDDATTVLGVGKNMVRAIRYWCLAYKVLAEVPSKNNPRVSDLLPTDFGKKLLSERGWDPYLEDPGSLWLLHWHLLRAPCKAPSWWAIFNRARPQEFTDDAIPLISRRSQSGSNVLKSQVFKWSIEKVPHLHSLRSEASGFPPRGRTASRQRHASSPR